jgi:hypothetical protein
MAGVGMSGATVSVSSMVSMSATVASQRLQW